MKVMVIVKATKNSEAGVMPSEKLLSDMGKYNEELVKAGIMQAGEGLHPSVKGKRIKFSGGNKTVDRRSVRRDQGAHRGLLDLEGEVAGRGRLLGAPLPGSDAGRRFRARDPSGFRGGRFRRGVHAGAAGQEDRLRTEIERQQKQ